jgi:hypothetical protein
MGVYVGSISACANETGGVDRDGDAYIRVSFIEKNAMNESNRRKIVEVLRDAT